MSLKKEIAIVAVGLIGIGILWTGWQAYTGSNGPVACTEEAKICPDGSAVGRVGPHCEFSECPKGSAGTAMVRLNESATVGTITIQALEVVEDSRCPVDVECIWAGTVRLRAQLSSGFGIRELTFSLGTTITTEAETVTLAHVLPQPHAGEKIPPESYQFIFEVSMRSGSGIRGAVLLGPICPVERIPPDPACAAKPYATTLVVTTSDGAQVIKEFKSDANGTFSVNVPAGEYAIRSAAAANVLPFCFSNGTVIVESGAYTETTVSCDTGIR